MVSYRYLHKCLLRAIPVELIRRINMKMNNPYQNNFIIHLPHHKHDI